MINPRRRIIRLKGETHAGESRLLPAPGKYNAAAAALANGSLTRPLGSGNLIEGGARGLEAFMKTRAAYNEFERDQAAQEAEAARQAAQDKLAMDKFAWEKNKPMEVSAGATVFDPTTGQSKFTAPSAPRAPIEVNAGNEILLMDPTTREVLKRIPVGKSPNTPQFVIPSDPSQLVFDE